MRNFSNSKITKQILSIMLVFIISFTTIQPISNADMGGTLFKPIVSLLALLTDLGIELLQDFLWDGSNIDASNNYEVYIGPATIFTNKIPRIRC